MTTLERQAKESNETIRVRVLFFGAAREAAGRDEVEMNLRAPVTTANAFAEILSRYPALRRFGRALLFAVNQEYARGDVEVSDNDELAIFPPVSGGSGEADAETQVSGNAASEKHEDVGPDFFELTTEAIDVGEVARKVIPPECGATVTLDGYVREWTRGRARTLYLIYEAYPPMAVSEMRRLGREAHERFEIAHIGIVHRTGRLEIGETSVCVAVSAPHRRAAFEACEWAIRELKRTVPIWKKEFYEDGEVWVEEQE